MPTYAFTARSPAGRTVTGTRLSESEGALAMELSSGGLFLIRARPAAPTVHGKVKLTPQDLSSFLLHLASYLEAGLPLLNALQDYREPHRPAMEAAVADMARRLYGGALFSEVMAAHPGLFEPVHVGMVRAGESIGRMDQAIRTVIHLVEWNQALRARIREAATYPLILVCLLTFIILLVSAFSLPSILRLLEDLQIPLPLVTRVFLAVGRALSAYGLAAALLAAALALALKAALRKPQLRLKWDKALLSMPVVGSLRIRMALARFGHFLAAQYRAGVPLVEALRTSEEVTGNLWMGRCVRALREGVEQGQSMAVMAARVGYFPPLVIRMLAIGEETGNLEETLDKAAAIFDREVAEEVRVIFLLLDPAVKLIMGCGLIFVATAVLLPIYMLIGGING